MEKIIHISLNSSLYALEEPAHRLLENYLEEIRTAFEKEEGGQEILRDIEARIAEHLKKFSDKPINIAAIKNIIAIMGSVSELTGSTTTKTEGAPASTTNDNAPRRAEHKKLYRDVEHAYLGGVCAGIAAYLDTDPTWVRIAFVVLFFVGMGSMFPIYLLLWVIVPPALTAAEKLDMHGNPVTLNAIAYSVRKRIEELHEEHKNYHHHSHRHCCENHDSKTKTSS